LNGIMPVATGERPPIRLLDGDHWL